MLAKADAAGIALAVRLLREGKLVAFPTETVYGLGARALDADAVARIFEAKGRPRAHPLIAHVAGVEDGRAMAREWSERAQRLANAFWPGPLTLVVPRADRVPAIVAGGGDSVALRAPAHPVARALIEALGEPIAAPSANRYQTLSPTRAEHVVKSLGSRVDLVLDGGACEAGIESTVVDVRGDRARVLRPGALGIAELRAVERDIEMGAGVVADEEAERASPGMDARHYAPRARLLLFPRACPPDQYTGDPLSDFARHYAGTCNVGVVVRSQVAFEEKSIVVRTLPDEPIAYARELFAALHALDDLGVKMILVESVPGDEAWAAVADRLERARESH